MTRAHLDYTARRAPAAASAPAFNPDVPVEGFYRMKLVAGAVVSAIRIWFGPPLDPIVRTELDRSPRWNATANGKPIALDRVWPKCADAPIDAQEYAYLLARQSWAETNAPDTALADPKQRIDFLTAPLPF